MGGLLALALIVGSLTGFIAERVASSMRSQEAVDLQAEYNLLQENARELFRAEMISVMRINRLDTSGLVNGLQLSFCLNPEPPAGKHASCPAIEAEHDGVAPAWATALRGEHAAVANEIGIKVKVVAVSEPGASFQTIRVRFIPDTTKIKASVFAGTERAQLVLGTSGVFSNALTGDNFSCVFCHAHIYGDVGEYHSNFMPLTALTRVHGVWHSASSLPPVAQRDGIFRHSVGNVTCPAGATDWRCILPVGSEEESAFTDKTSDPFPPPGPLPAGAPPSYDSLNRNHLQGYLVARGWEWDYRGEKLPWNPQLKKYALPKFDPDSALYLATGCVKGARSFASYGTAALIDVKAETCIGPIVEGNLILGPDVTIDGRVFVRGDVVISGNVTGQGVIYAGRNIYVPDDLRYKNRPALFDGSLKSNQILSTLSPAVFPGNAAKARHDDLRKCGGAECDQLALVAANNVVIGDPFTDKLKFFGTEGYLGADIRYLISATLLRTVKDSLAIDKNTGYLRDLSPEAGGCYIHSWGPQSDCKPKGDGSLLQLDVHPTFAAVKGVPAFGGKSDAELSLIRLNRVPLPTIYSELFVPKNWSQGKPIEWISRADFTSKTTNPVDKGAFGRNAGDLRHKVMKDWFIPFPAANPYNPSTWDFNYFRDELDRHSGVFGTQGLAAVPAQMRNRPAAPALQVTALKRFEDFFYRCQRAAVGDMAVATDPLRARYVSGGLGLNALNTVVDANGNVAVTGRQPLAILKNNNIPMLDAKKNAQFARTLTCRFWYDKSWQNGDPNPSEGRVWEELYYSDDGQHPAHVCQDTEAYRTIGGETKLKPLTTGYHGLIGYTPETPATAGITFETPFDPGDCQPYHRQELDGERVGPDLAAPNLRYNDYTRADFYAEITVNAFPDLSLAPAVSLRVSTRYFDDSLVRVFNRISTVDSFLFANQYVVYLTDRSNDKQLSINGGVVARDFGGRMIDRFGFSRSYTTRKPRAAQHQYFKSVTPSGSPAFILRWDPRFENNMGLIYKDFGAELSSK